MSTPDLNLQPSPEQPGVTDTTRAARQVQSSASAGARRRDWTLAAGLFVAISCLGLLFAHNFAWTGGDEGEHFDYVYKVAQGQLVPAPGRVNSGETMRVLSCRPTVWNPHPNCSVLLRPDQVPVGAVNYVLAYGPVYYWPTALGARVIHATMGTSWFLAARATTALFAGLGAAALFLVALRYGARRWTALGVVLTLACTPMVFINGATTTPDSLALLAGAAAAWVPTLRLAFKRRVAVALCLGVLIALTKPNLVPLGCLAVLLAAVMPRDDSEPFSTRRILWRPRTLLALALALVPLLAAVAWNLWEGSRLPPGVRADGGLNDMLRYDGPVGALFVQSLQTMLTPLGDPSLAAAPTPAAIATLAACALLGCAVLVTGSQRFDSASRVKTLSAAGLIGVAMTAVYVPLVLYVSYHASGTQGRYVIPVFAMLAIPLAVSLDGRIARWLPLALGAIAWIAMLLAVVDLHWVVP